MGLILARVLLGSKPLGPASLLMAGELVRQVQQTVLGRRTEVMNDFPRGPGAMKPSFGVFVVLLLMGSVRWNRTAAPGAKRFLKTININDN